MIISHKYKYLFIEVPITGSCAVRNELCEYYGGEPILHKHASYLEFQKVATGREKSYFVFAAVRHPMDEVVSRYFKLVTNHRGAFSKDENSTGLETERADHRRYLALTQKDMDFTSYVLKHHRRIFSSMIDLSSDYIDYVIRFEHLQQSFSQVLQLLDIERIRQLPIRNRTGQRRRDWQSYYTDDMQSHCQRVFGPFMQKWGYEFPEGWGRVNVTSGKKVKYRLACSARQVYFTSFRYQHHRPAKFVRWLRANLVN